MAPSFRSKLAKNAAAALFGARCAAVLATLGLRRDPAATTLRRAIIGAADLGFAFNHEEREWLRRIEALRSRLDASTTPIDVIDHGAGSAIVSGSSMDGRSATRSVGEVCYGASKRPAQARFLFRLVRALRPVVALELGTCLGISTAYESAALAINGCGRLHTMEGSPALAALARDNLEQLGLATVEVHVGRFDALLDPWLDQEPSVSFVFVDGHHDESATEDYWRRLRPHLSTRAVAVFDDIRWSSGMRRAWTAIKADRSVHTAADLGTMGVCLVGDW